MENSGTILQLEPHDPAQRDGATKGHSEIARITVNGAELQRRAPWLLSAWAATKAPVKCHVSFRAVPHQKHLMTFISPICTRKVDLNKYFYRYIAA